MKQFTGYLKADATKSIIYGFEVL